MATGVQIGDRLLDICQILSKKGGSASAESDTRKESAQKLKELAKILETEPMGDLEEYDRLVKSGGHAAGSTTEKSQGKALDLLLGLN